MGSLVVGLEELFGRRGKASRCCRDQQREAVYFE